MFAFANTMRFLLIAIYLNVPHKTAPAVDWITTTVSTYMSPSATLATVDRARIIFVNPEATVTHLNRSWKFT